MFKRKNKKIISFMLAGCMIFGCLPATNANAAAKTKVKTITKYYNYSRSILLQDAKGFKKITVNKKKKKNIKGRKYVTVLCKKAGKYTINTVNKKGKKKKYVIYIDKTKPSVKGVKNSGIYLKNVTVKIKDNCKLSYVTLNGKKQKKTTFKVTKNGVYTLIAKDKAGNTKIVVFTIKKKSATATPTATVSVTQPPSVSGTAVPSTVPTTEPSEIVTSSAIPGTTDAPSVENSFSPNVSMMPTKTPSENATVEPSIIPSQIPVFVPSVAPTKTPVVKVTTKPTKTPGVSVTKEPSLVTNTPTATTGAPTKTPTTKETQEPLTKKSPVPSVSPTVTTTVTPTKAPVIIPTVSPTETPILDDSKYLDMNWKYELDDTEKTITLTNYIGQNTEVRIENEYYIDNKQYKTRLGSTVLYGGPNASAPFANNINIKKVTFADNFVFPKNVSNLFYKCTSLKEVDGFTGDFTEMDNTFRYCSSLNDILTIPASVKNADYAFEGCTSLKTMPLFEVNSKLTTAYCMFSGCTQLSETVNKTSLGENILSLPEGLKEMGRMFYGCTSLNFGAGYIPDSVTTATSAFENCTSLYYMPSISQKSLMVYMSQMFKNCSYLCKGNIVIPDKVKRVDELFYGCSFFHYYGGSDVTVVWKINFDTIYTKNLFYNFAHCSLNGVSGTTKVTFIVKNETEKNKWKTYLTSINDTETHTSEISVIY